MAHAFSNEDAFGKTFYGYKCFNRFYPAHNLYAAANHVCANYEARIKYDTHESQMYRNELVFGNSIIDNKLKMLEGLSMIPILLDGTIYPFELKPERRLTKNSDGEIVIIEPGHDRLVVDKDCNIMNVFTVLVSKSTTKKGRTQDCRVMKSLENRLSPPPGHSRSRSDSYDGFSVLYEE